MWWATHNHVAIAHPVLPDSVQQRPRNERYLAVRYTLPARRSKAVHAFMTGSTKSPESGSPQTDDGLAEKQQMVEKLFRHTNEFLEQNKDDPLLVVEALAAILVRYTALLGPVEQMGARLDVLEGMIGKESEAIQAVAKAQHAAEKAD